MEIKIYTDGSCLGNPGPGGYCAILKAIKNGKVVKEKIIKGAEANTTNNRMELKAVIEALKALSKKDQKITLYTDSQYVANGIKLWLKNWIKKDFKDVKNEDLWKELCELLKNQNIEVKAKIRRRMMELSRSRMMQEVPKASVVITNPTHFAVALRYIPKQDRAPVVVAKGQDYMAKKIIEIAELNDVPVVRKPELARALYKAVDIEEEIPPEFYKAVAEIIAYIVKRKQRGLL